MTSVPLRLFYCFIYIFDLVKGTEGKIVGGMESNIKLWPSTVALYRFFNDNFYNNNYLLSTFILSISANLS